MLLTTMACALILQGHDIEVDGIYYDLHGEEATVTYRTSYWSQTYSGDVVIPETVTYDGHTYTVTAINTLAFRDNNQMTHIELPNTIKHIGDSAFMYCYSLKSLHIPKSVTHIGQGALIQCDALESLTVDPENPVYDSRDSCNAIIETATDRLTHGCPITVIPNTVKIIGRQAFAYSHKLSKVVMPNSVKVIERAAFQLSSSIRSIEFSDSLERIEPYAFVTCAGLSRVNLPKTVKYIGEWAFAMTYLDYINIEAGDVYYSVGSNCIIERATKTIIAGSKHSYIPYGVTVERIGPAAFAGCVTMTDLVLPRTLKEIGPYAFYLCYSAYEINIPDGVTSIGDYAFYNCHTAWTLKIGKSLKSIGRGVFQGCSGATTVVIPDSVESIGYQAFQNCLKLKDLTIGSGVKTIDEEAFMNCNALTSVTCMAPEPPVMASENCFSDSTYIKAILHVPSSTVSAYKTADYWYLFDRTLGNTVCDVDGDGNIDIGDVTSLIDSLLGLDNGTYVMTNADVNGDGVVNINDVTDLIDILLGVNTQ